MKYKIFVINMPSNEKRWSHVRGLLDSQGLAYERVDGIDVCRLSEQEVGEYYSKEKNRKEFYRYLRVGEIGCHIAHIKCFEEIERQGLDFAIILEDDINISANLKESIDFLSQHISEWDLVRLQVEHKKGRLIYSEKTFGSFKFREFIRNSGCTWGYAITKDAANICLKNLKPFGMTADTNMHAYFKYGVDVLTLYPPSIFEGNGFSSDIALIDKLQGGIVGMKNFYLFSHQRFSFLLYVKRFCYLLKRDGFRLFLKRVVRIKKTKEKV